MGEDIIKTKVPSTLTLKVDQKVFLEIDEEAIHLFNEKKGEALF